MVGFGSTFRMARRIGWDRAYLDYETLKMLLSQIEAVYEEEGHRQQQNTDYRDELFLESDSDLAFESSQQELTEEAHLLSTDEERGRDTGKASQQPFSLTYSLERGSSSDLGDYQHDSDSDVDLSTQGCPGAPLSWTSKTANNNKSQKTSNKSRSRDKRNNNLITATTTSASSRRHDEDLDHYFLGAGPTTFFMENTSPDNEHESEVSSLLLNKTLTNDTYNGLFFPNTAQSTSTSSSSGNLPNSNPSFYNIHPHHQPRDFVHGSPSGRWHTSTEKQKQYQATAASSASAAAGPSSSTATAKEERQKLKLEEERRTQRRKRRKLLAQKRKERERRVPKHLRIAHTKARAITERFLGLLRAEVEKVTLFAQSRLGELADTAGSLRFPSYEDDDFGGSNSSMGRNRTTSFDHPLSDGGRHPSASSSSDDGEGRGQGIFPWSDSDDDKDKQSDSSINNRRKSPNFVSPLSKSNSGGGLSVATAPLSNVTTGIQSPPHRTKRPSTHSKSHHSHKRSTPHNAKTHDEAACASAQRQINHFAELRQQRPVFQRIDHIVGEDLLLLSAVDEADGYTAVGVELMHVLRFICVNVIAVRKICRKHDRLLMNRMLGGYYHRKRKEQGALAKDADAGSTSNNNNNNNNNNNTMSPNTITLGGIVSRSMGDQEGDPTDVFVTAINQNKLVGVYDVRIQELANSNTVQVISSCIALALSEYEVSHSRADALAKLNSSTPNTQQSVLVGSRDDSKTKGILSVSPFGLSPSRWTKKAKAKPSSFDEDANSNEDNGNGPPSTASGISLTRLRFTVVSIFALREVARLKQDSYKAFMSRASLVFTGPNVLGEGLDGCSRAILDFFNSYSPDAALLLSSSGLHKGLQKGEWKERPIGNLMLSCLAMAVQTKHDRDDLSEKLKEESKEDVIDAVSVMPISGDVRYLDDNQDIKRRMFMSNIPDLLGKGINPVTLQLNRMGLFLYSMNYYLAHSTANAFVMQTGAHAPHSASIIGGASAGALMASVLQLRSMSFESNKGNQSSFGLQYFRQALLQWTIFPIIGNVIHAIAVSRGSIALAVFGRFVLGFGSADCLHRQLLSQCLPAPHVVYESSNLMHSQLLGVAVGLLGGGFLALSDVEVQGATISSLHTGSYFMAALWSIHLVRLYFLFQEQSSTDDNIEEEGKEASTDPEMNEFSTGSSEVDTGTPESVFYERSTPEGTDDELNLSYINELQATYGSLPIISSTNSMQGPEQEYSRAKPAKEVNSTPVKKTRARTFQTLASRIRRVVFYNVAIPVMLAIIVFARISHEILFTSCTIITNRYFGWNGSQACFLLGVLSASVFPINYIAERIARSYDERTVIKRSLYIAFIGFIVMMNWASLINLAVHLRNLMDRAEYTNFHPYDWVFGPLQYLIGFCLSYIGLMSLEPTTLALMSKVAPSRMRSVAINCGSIVTIVSLAARFLGDAHILMVGLSHRLINIDMVNSLIIPMIVGCAAAVYIVRRHFFFLM